MSNKGFSNTWVGPGKVQPEEARGRADDMARAALERQKSLVIDIDKLADDLVKAGENKNGP
jgi:polyhydroxyalkanoate synthesis regulator phasin